MHVLRVDLDISCFPPHSSGLPQIVGGCSVDFCMELVDCWPPKNSENKTFILSLIVILKVHACTSPSSELKILIRFQVLGLESSVLTSASTNATPEPNLWSTIVMPSYLCMHAYSVLEFTTCTVEHDLAAHCLTIKGLYVSVTPLFFFTSRDAIITAILTTVFLKTNLFWMTTLNK